MEENKINLAYIIEAINKGKLREEDVYAAKEILENEIMQCEDILSDHETELHSRREFQGKLQILRKLKKRL
jgi:hypothetical protein